MATYYVKNSGNDANTGLSDGQAWQTIDKLNFWNTALNPGDTVLFKRGDTWREQLRVQSGSGAGYITYGAYGTGAKPKFLGSVTANSGWTNISGNIWQNSNAAFTIDVGNLIFNNESSCGVKLMSASPSFTTQGQFWYDFANDRIRMYSVGNPATFYSNIECALSWQEGAIIESGESYFIFQNIDFRYWGCHAVGNGGSNSQYLDCNFSYIGGADAGLYGGTPYIERLGNAHQIWEGGHDITVERCTFDNIYDAATSLQGSADNYDVYNVYIRNNIISRSEYSFEYWNSGSGVTETDIYFENNTCLWAGGGFGHNQRPDDTNGKHLMFFGINATQTRVYVRNNILFESTEGLIWFINDTDVSKIVVDYNSLYTTTGCIGTTGYADHNIGNSVYNSLATWTAATGHDIHSIGSNPMLVSSTDFHLQPLSPCINTGVNNGLTTDFDLITRTLQDIGAYEFITQVGSLVITISNQSAVTGSMVVTISGQTVPPVIQDPEIFKVQSIKLYIGKNLVDG